MNLDKGGGFRELRDKYLYMGSVCENILRHFDQEDTLKIIQNIT
jgi:hypothetical protein